MMKRPIIYLACPYTHIDASVREQRFIASARAAAALIKQGNVVYSPITMTHPIDQVLAGENATMGSVYWLEFDSAFMEICSEMVVLTLEGWRSSEGVQREIAYFRDGGKRVRYMAVDDLKLIESPYGAKWNT